MHDYVRTSLELHLFFARIMKEHAIFLQLGFMPINSDFVHEAMWYKKQFEMFLLEAVKLSNFIISPKVLNSGEIVTSYTLGAEQKTEELTGIDIDTNITNLELKLRSGNGSETLELFEDICFLNNTALDLLAGFIDFKERILNDVLICKMFTVNYPLLIEHILREARLYREYVDILQNGKDINNQNMQQVEIFWNQIMMEHALFIRGLLDPTENDLIDTANTFADEYKKLVYDALAATDETINSITDKAIQETAKYIDFKTAGTEGISECKIRSIILPLLADHVLREANHYFRILKN